MKSSKAKAIKKRKAAEGKGKKPSLIIMYIVYIVVVDIVCYKR